MNERLKEILRELRMNQKEFAKSLGISQGTVSKYINGALLIDKKFALLIETVHKINSEWLLTGEGIFIKTKNDVNYENFILPNEEKTLFHRSINLTNDEFQLILQFRENGYRGVYNLCKNILKEFNGNI